MAFKVRREIVVGAAAVALVAVAALVFFRGGSSPESAGVTRPPAAARQAAAPAGHVVELDLKVLDAPTAEPADTERNPFQFKAAARPPSAPSVAGPVSEAPPPLAPPVLASPPPEARIPLKFIGIVDAPNAGRLAVLTDGRGVYHGREGDTIEGRYRVVRIGVESVELAFINGRGSQVIRLTGQ